MTDFPYMLIFYWTVAIVVAAPFLWKRAQFRRKSRQAVAWQPITARIQIAEMENVGRDNGIRVTLGYSYFLDEYHSGEYVVALPTTDQAHDFARLLKDAPVPARFNPQRPSESVLDEKSLFSVFAAAKTKELEGETDSPLEIQFERAEYGNHPSPSSE